MSSFDPPDFVSRSDLLDRAYHFALDAHEGERSRGETRIDHPTAVAKLLARQGADDQIVAVALLHDVLEDTTVTREELEREFGPEIAGLVADLSEDASIDAYADRKTRLREQVAAAGEEAATIFLADKLARLHDARGDRATALARDARPLPREPRVALQAVPGSAVHPRGAPRPAKRRARLTTRPVWLRRCPAGIATPTRGRSTRCASRRRGSSCACRTTRTSSSSSRRRKRASIRRARCRSACPGPTRCTSRMR